MKIRNGFVSNSSSSSFVILGVIPTMEMLFRNEEFKIQFGVKYEDQRQKMIITWEKKMNHPDFQKHQMIYETCTTNKVSIPSETQSFFGYEFKGNFGPQEPDEKKLFNSMIKNEEFTFPKGISTISGYNMIYFGRLITVGEDQLNSGDLSVEQLLKMVEEMKTLGFEESDIKLYYGSIES